MMESVRTLHVRKIIGIVLIICGVLAVLIPALQAMKTDRESKAVIREFQENGLDTDGKELFLEQIIQYNQEIFENHQKDFSNEETVAHRPEQLQEMETDLFGILEIPAMDCQLPLYLGASAENMGQGAAVLGGTSIPIGGINTNSVIAGHRGWKKRKFFKEIEKLDLGDKIYVTNPWETLCYRVERIEVIEPSDSEKVKIQQEKDMITLITCHPYRSGGRYRYVVYCERDS